MMRTLKGGCRTKNCPAVELTEFNYKKRRVEMRKSLLQAVMVLTVLSLVLSACGAQAPATEVVAGFQIPAVEEGKFNVGMVLIGPHNDGGWSQAHYEGLLEIEKNVPNTHVAYIELVPEGADSEQVFRSL